MDLHWIKSESSQFQPLECGLYLVIHIWKVEYGKGKNSHFVKKKHDEHLFNQMINITSCSSKCLYTPQIHILKSNPQCGGIWEVIRS